MKKTKILIVEDEAIVAKDIASILRTIGYEVPAVVATGEEALQIAAQTRPDLVLMDIVLRGKENGVEAAEKIRFHLGIPVVYLTAYADEKTLERAKIAEPFGYLLKPFQERELRSTIELALYKYQIEKRLKESEEKFKVLFDEAPVGYHEYDPQGIIININRTELGMLGFSREELIGKPVWKLAQEEEKVRQLVLDKLAGTLPPGHGVEWIFRRKDGTTFPVLIEDRLLRDEEGRITGIRTTIQDISDRKALENQLAQVQKLEAIGQLAAGITHDFNNVLTVIRGNADLLLLNMDSCHPLHGPITEIQKATEKASNLTRQLLAFSRRQILQPKVVNPAELIHNFSKMLRRLIGEDIELKIELEPGLGNVYADPTALEQVLMNLAVNAREAMPQGGRFWIQGQNALLDPSFCQRFPFAKPGRYVHLSASDNGKGMAEEVLQRIFEPFFTTKEQGTGLGLSVVYGIIKQHEGYITASSRPGEGSRFDLFFPLWMESATREAEPVSSIAIPRGHETILVAEDEVMVRRLLKNFLERLGYKVILASNGEEAWDLFFSYPLQIHLIISDAVMPKLSGPNLYERVHHLNPRMPFILISGYSEEMNRKRFAQTLGLPLFLKPIDLQAMGIRLRELLDQQGKAPRSGLEHDFFQA